MENVDRSKVLMKMFLSTSRFIGRWFLVDRFNNDKSTCWYRSTFFSLTTRKEERKKGAPREFLVMRHSNEFNVFAQPVKTILDGFVGWETLLIDLMNSHFARFEETAVQCSTRDFDFCPKKLLDSNDDLTNESFWISPKISNVKIGLPCKQRSDPLKITMTERRKVVTVVHENSISADEKSQAMKRPISIDLVLFISMVSVDLCRSTFDTILIEKQKE